VIATQSQHPTASGYCRDGAGAAWLLHRISERHLAYTTVNQAVCALKSFFDTVLGRRVEASTIPYAHTGLHFILAQSRKPVAFG